MTQGISAPATIRHRFARSLLRAVPLGLPLLTLEHAYAAQFDVGAGSSVHWADATIDFGCADFSVEGDADATSARLAGIGSMDLSGTGAFAPGAASVQLGGIDYADKLPAADDLEAGDVVAIGDDGLMHKSTGANETDVAGVYSTQPGVIGRREEEARATIPVALAGVIPVKASVENGAIRAGDLLVSSSTPGCAMRAPPAPAPGTVIGKAMQKLDAGNGKITMLVMLR